MVWGKISIILFVLLLSGCSFVAKKSTMNECGRTTGYTEKQVASNVLIITIYSGLNWSESKKDKILNERSELFCKSNKFSIERNTNAITYLDGCLHSGNAFGEASWKLKCH